MTSHNGLTSTGEGSRRKDCFEGTDRSNSGFAGRGDEQEFHKAKLGYHDREGTSSISSDYNFEDCECPCAGTEYIELTYAKSKDGEG